MDPHDSLANIRVKDVMSTIIICVNETDSILFTIKMFERARINGAPVVNADGEFICLLTKSDLLDEDFISRMMQHDNPGDLIVKDFIKPSSVVTIHEDVPVQNAALLMVERRVHRLVVLNENGALSGIISSFDIVRAVASMSLEQMGPSSHRGHHLSMDKKAKILRLQEELHRRP